MNAALAAQFRSIRSAQKDLRECLIRLDERIDTAEHLVREQPVALIADPAACAVPGAPSPEKCPLPARKAEPLPPSAAPPATVVAAPVVIRVADRIADPAAEEARSESAAPVPPVSLPVPPASPPVPPPHRPPVRPLPEPEPALPFAAREEGGEEAEPAEGQGIEMRLGTYWLVRIGMLLVLTGLVFLGNFAWHAWVPLMGKGGRLASLTGAGVLLSCLGMWVHRGAAQREGLRHYSLVLLGGGLATLYYSAYAAHFVESLRVIGSPVAGGSLLLGMAALIVLVAERWRSETVALLAVLLSFYTGAMNPIAEFSLFSNLLLAGAAIWFLVRHQWAHLTYASLVGSYAAFGFWRVFQQGFVVWGTGLSEPEFWTSRGFLLSYWILFTVAFSLRGSRRLPPVQRAVAVAANNAAFFAYSGPALAQFHPGSFWILPSILGGILTLQSRVARRRGDDPLIESSLLAQGLGLLLLGLASRVTGYSLALCTAVEAALLLWFSGRDVKQKGVYQGGAVVCSAVAMMVSGSLLLQRQGHLPALGVAAVFFFMAWLYRRIRGVPGTTFEPVACFLSLAASLLIGIVTLQQAWPQWCTGLAFAGVSAAAFIAWRRLQMPEAAGVVHLGVLAVVLPAVVQALEGAPDRGLLLIAGLSSVVLSQFWRHRQFGGILCDKCEWAFAGTGSVLVLLAWRLFAGADGWIAAGAAAAMVWLAAGLLLRSVAIGVWSQAALFTALLSVLGRMIVLPSSAWLVWIGAAIFGFGAHAALRKGTAGNQDWHPAVQHAAAAWRVVAVLLLARLLFNGIDGGFHLLVALQALAWLVAGRWFKWAEVTHCGAVLAAVWLICGIGYGIAGHDTAAIVASALIMLTAVQLVGRRWSHLIPGDSLRHACSAGAITVLTAAITGGMRAEFGPPCITAVWSLLGCLVFAAGVILRDRGVRRPGLCLLALALGRIFVVDVWQLSTLGRIISFMALGGVLLAVGFIYNRFAERISRWL